jgi:hypothetical protein
MQEREESEGGYEYGEKSAGNEGLKELATILSRDDRRGNAF